MGIMRLKEIRDASPEDRAKKLIALRAEQARIKTMVNAGGAVENPTRVRELRKTIAQILTVENEMKLGIGKSSGGPQEKPRTEKPTSANKDESEEKES